MKKEKIQFNLNMEKRKLQQIEACIKSLEESKLKRLEKIKEYQKQIEE